MGRRPVERGDRSVGAGGKRAGVRRGAVETPPVQSVERALSLLEAVAGSADPVPLARLTEILGIDQSSVFRLANTLKRRGFLANPNGRKHDVLGPAIWRLSREYDWSGMLISVCRDAVKALAARTGETAHLAVRDGREVLFIDHHASGDQGIIVPGIPEADAVALHRARQVAARRLRTRGTEGPLRLRSAPALHPAHLRVAAGLAKVCSSARAHGFSMDDREYLEDVSCVAAPFAIAAARARLDRRLRAGDPDGRTARLLAQHVSDTAHHINALLEALLAR